MLCQGVEGGRFRSRHTGTPVPACCGENGGGHHTPFLPQADLVPIMTPFPQVKALALLNPSPSTCPIPPANLAEALTLAWPVKTRTKTRT